MDELATLATDEQIQDLLSPFAQFTHAPELWHQNIDNALEHVAKYCRIQLACDHVSIWTKNEFEAELVCKNRHGNTQEGIASVVVIDYQICANLFRDPFQYIASLDAISSEPLKKQHALKQTTQKTLIGKIKNEGRVVGFVCFEREAYDPWPEHYENFVYLVTELLAKLFIYHELHASEHKYKTLFNSYGDASFILVENYFADCNPSALKMFGCDYHQIVGQTPYRFSPERQPDGRLSVEKAMEKITAAYSGEVQFFEWQHLRFDGTPFDAEVTLTAVEMQGKTHIISAVRDVSDRIQRERHIRDMHALQTAIFNSANYAIISTNLQGEIISFNRAAERMLGYSDNEVINTKTITAFYEDRELEVFAEEITRQCDTLVTSRYEALTHKARYHGTDEQEWTYIKKSGDRFPGLLSLSAIYDQEGKISGFLSVISDITESKSAQVALLRSKQELEFRANHDSLTGLPNRSRFHEDLKHAIVAAQEASSLVSLLLLDLDRFKEVNDTLGHYTGDKLLQKVSNRLRLMLNGFRARLYRLGGDEFAILVPNIHAHPEAVHIAAEINHVLRSPIEVEGVTLELGGSIGVSCYPQHGDDAESLLRCADVAMYKAKFSSAGTILYNQELDSHSPKRLAMMAELGTAIREEQLELHFQPRLNLVNNKCIGCEALLRWRHPTHGLVPPGDFIPLAEMSDLIRPLSMWVVRSALHHCTHWHELGFDLSIAVNLSTRNLLDLTFSEFIGNLLQEYRFPPEFLEIEITESALISDPERTMRVLSRINELGVRLSIDDFGTGYSSMSYLKRLPIDTLKIDRSFIEDMCTDEHDEAIVNSILGLADTFDLQVIAEGVENSDTLKKLKLLGCEYAQGAYFSNPLCATDFTQWLDGKVA